MAPLLLRWQCSTGQEKREVSEMASKNRSGDEFGDLLERAQSGSEDALWELVNRVTPYVFRVVRRRMAPGLRRRYDSNDIVQIAWASFLLRDAPLTAFSNERQLLAYVAGVAANKVAMAMRGTFDQACRDPRREVGIDDAVGMAVADSGPSPSEVAEFRDDWHRLVESSEPAERRIVDLRLSGLPIDEIAAQLGIGEKTVRRKLKALCERVAA